MHQVRFLLSLHPFFSLFLLFIYFWSFLLWGKPGNNAKKWKIFHFLYVTLQAVNTNLYILFNIFRTETWQSAFFVFYWIVAFWDLTKNPVKLWYTKNTAFFFVFFALKNEIPCFCILFILWHFYTTKKSQKA